MGASIRAGLLAAQSDDPTAVLLTLVDLVDVPTAAHARLLARAHESALGRVFWGGRPGHPVLLGSAHVPAALDLSHGDSGPRALFTRAATRGDLIRVDCGPSVRGIDIDTPEDLARRGLTLAPCAEAHRAARHRTPLAAVPSPAGGPHRG